MGNDVSVLDKKLDATSLSMKQVELTPEQKRKWVETRTKFLYDAPGFAAVMYKMMNPRCREVMAVFTDMGKGVVAATDGLYVIINPEEFFGFKLKERVFILAHEVVHAICNHPIQLFNCRRANKMSFSDGTSLPFSNQLWQVAADYVINAILATSNIGALPNEGKVNIDKWYHINKAGNAMGAPHISHKDSVPDAYRKLWQDMPCNGGRGKHGLDMTKGGEPGELSGTESFDQLLDPGKGEGKQADAAKQQRSEHEWKTAVAAAMESARLQGKLPGAMQDVFTEVLEPKVSWQDYIHGWARRKMGGGSYNFQRPDRRLICRQPRIYAPSRSGFGADHVVVAVDTSGSIGKAEVNMFFAELSGVLDDVHPANLWVMWCDAHVHRVDRVEDTSDLQAMYEGGVPGRGGTSFVPVFEKIKEMDIKPDALVYLTDGYGTFPSDPGYHVLWGSIALTPQGYPFGEVVMIPRVGS
jgi:predicted metal-dependent peptidase